jgi:hypothetical protein
MKTENENLANEIINSFYGIKSAEPSPFLYTKILNKVSLRIKERTSIKAVWIAAASFTLLIVVNFALIKKETAKTINEKKSLEQLANHYQLINTNTLNYN